MRHKMMTTSILTATLFTFAAGGAFAQHEAHHPDNQATQTQPQPSGQPAQSGMMGGGMMGGGMMGGSVGMMAMTHENMGQMMTRNKEMSGLMAKLMTSMQAIENEKNPAALKQELAEHRALLNQMQDHTVQQNGMMQNMSGMMMCNKMMGNDTKPSTK